MESITNQSNIESKYILPCIGGLFIPVTSTTICRPFVSDESIYGTIILLTLFLLVGFVSVILGATSKKRVFFLVLVSLPIGVIINIVIDSYLWGTDHNLFPFEFLIYPLLAFIPLLLGINLGGIFSSNKSSNLTVRHHK
jgi:peptidoglycan/LPS O-acetylase OafA/YrhL